MSDLVIAYVINDAERRLVHERLSDPEDRGGTVLGHADATTVAELREQGVLIDEVDVAADREQSRSARSDHSGCRLGPGHRSAGGLLPDGVAGTFDVDLTGPLTDDQREQIEATGARFAERLGNYTWAVLATNAQARDVTSLGFVAGVARPGRGRPGAAQALVPGARCRAGDRRPTRSWSTRRVGPV